MSAFELDTQKLAGVRRHALVLKEIATAANDVDTLVDGKLDASDQRVAQSLPTPSSHLDLRPGKMRIQVHV